tara:strand:+ start:116 stop:310 length:195 start_codon:yes stop_codon:yes gene_type:complete
MEKTMAFLSDKEMKKLNELKNDEFFQLLLVDKLINNDDLIYFAKDEVKRETLINKLLEDKNVIN